MSFSAKNAGSAGYYVAQNNDSSKLVATPAKKKSRRPMYDGFVGRYQDKTKNVCVRAAEPVGAG
jgi:hypothetical protein